MSMVAHWKMDDDAANAVVVDDTVGGNDGVLHDVGGTATKAAHTILGKVNQGLLFDGVDDHIIVADANELDLATGSISLWFKPSIDYIGGAGHTYEYLLSKGVGSALYLRGVDSKLGFDNTVAAHTYSNLGVFLANHWYHAVVTDDGTTTKMYVDGKLQSDTGDATGGDFLNTTGDLNIGREQGGAVGDYVHGRIDDLRFYDAVLTAWEVMRLYQQGIGIRSLVKGSRI